MPPASPTAGIQITAGVSGGLLVPGHEVSESAVRALADGPDRLMFGITGPAEENWAADRWHARADSPRGATFDDGAPREQ